MRHNLLLAGKEHLLILEDAIDRQNWTARHGNGVESVNDLVCSESGQCAVDRLIERRLVLDPEGVGGEAGIGSGIRDADRLAELCEEGIVTDCDVDIAIGRRKGVVGTMIAWALPAGSGTLPVAKYEPML